ncbi:hypothetical protein [Corynebacterium variabile]|uniref:hypothetical protein n=1 Tax=Corynebacterium variabile TaxID=1727 RepID=UPI003BAF05CB
MPWSPHDLPFLVANLVEVADGEASSVTAVCRRLGTDPADPDDQFAVLGQRQRSVAESARAASLAWMDEDICELVRQTAPTVPSWTPVAVMPYPSGLIAFEKRVMTAAEDHAEDAAQVNVDAVLWQERDGVIYVTALSQRRGARRPDALNPLTESLARLVPDMPLPALPPARIGELFTLTIDPQVVQGGGDDPTITGKEDDAPGDLDVKTYHFAAQEALRILGATWLLMSQPRLVEEGPAAEATVKTTTTGSAGAPSRRVKQRVRVSVRRLTAEHRRQASERARSRGAATSRWWVRGHWRQQAWGKDRKLRKPVYIEPHTAGARDVENTPAEVDPRPTVQVWRT